MKKMLIPGLLLILAFATGWFVKSKMEEPERALKTANQVHVLFQFRIEKLDTCVAALRTSIQENRPVLERQEAFRRARLAYKEVEFLTELYFPTTSKSLNGPPVDEVEEDTKVVPPQGFQVVEEFLFPTDEVHAQKEALVQVDMLRASVHRLRYLTETTVFTDSHIFDAIRLEIFRVITLGISGFDSPAAQHSLPEAVAALGSLKEVFATYLPTLQTQKPQLARQVTELLEANIRYLQTSTDFNGFDRLTYITQYANPLSSRLLDAQQALDIPVFKELRALSPSAKTLFDEEAFNPDFFAPDHSSHRTPERVSLGKMLFFDPVLSGDGSRSCASCHRPEKAFTDGQAKSLAFGTAGTVRRNAPTMLNAGLQASQFYDSRVIFLEDQVKDVVSNAEEMHGSMDVAAERLSKNASYQALFAKAFPNQKEAISTQQVRVAMASYLRSLTSLNSRFDRHVRGEKTLLNASEKAGFNLFMGKAKCATCHFMPLFNGTVPPAFNKSESEVLGVPATAQKAGARVDADLGKFNLNGMEVHRHAFKTPTIRNVALTAPYMHNGVYTTLEEVMEFYNEGGAAGLSIDLPNQTLSPDPLQLTKQEQQDIISFLHALTDVNSAQ